ncbi:hypothetical protein R5R35_004383 [Gryllus longicercus]|uniref:Telomeric repeat-binding factor 2-interacting protein 1 n=2 Tax=Gryllus longicercus TaxID=2509291 RepID=A0AAN9VED1_9ORTH
MEKQGNMELSLDTETPEKRVLSWLSQTDMPASIRNNCEVSATLNGTNKNNCAKIKNVSKSVRSCVRQLPKRYQKCGLNRYFSINYENNDESASSDSERELQEHSRGNRLYCDAERNLIIRYIVEKKLFPFLKGNTIWKQMEKERICCRSWQSMKTQFHKYIYPHLDDFDISDTDRCYFALSMTRSPFKKSVGFLSPGQRGWRKNGKFYTFVEDAIILYYILEKERYGFANGNTLWQRMESKHVVPGRSWHSMKSRYKNFLSKYIERVSYPMKNGNTSQKKKLGAVEKTKLLQDFMVDHLNDVAATIGCITNSNESLEELRCLGIDSSFSIPLPENDTDFTEREVIKKCVWDIAQQLDGKFKVLIEYSNKTAMKCKEIINVFSPKYSEYFKCREQSLCSRECNSDLSESVQRGLKISSPTHNARKLFQNPEKSSNKPCTIVNPESDTLDRINFSENVVCERIIHLTEKVGAGVKDCPYNAGENVPDFHLHNSSVSKGDVHFSNTLTKTSTISQNTGNVDEETTEILNCSEIGDENPLGNILQDDYTTSDAIHCDSRYSNGEKEMQQNNQNSSSTYNIHMPESFSTVNSLCASVQNDEFIKLPKLTLASVEHAFSNFKNEDTKEVNKSCNTFNTCSNVCDMSSVKLRPSSATTQEKVLAPEIQRKSNNNKQNNLYRNSLILEAIQKAECSDAMKKLCLSEMHPYSVSLNIPENTFTKKPLDMNVESDCALKNTIYYISEESNTLDSSRKSKSDSGKRVRISNEFDNDKLSTCFSAHVYVDQNSKDLMVDDSCKLETSSNLNSCHVFTRQPLSNNNHTQLHDKLELHVEQRLHLTEEADLEPDLRLHLSEDDSEEEPELHLHISEESEGECELKSHLTENETGKIQ